MPHEIVNADVMNWSSSYGGEKYHALLCDPPYELGFMGRDWDRSGVAFNPETWRGLAAHLYPGAFGFAFASSRGCHRMAVAIEDAGFIIHPTIFCWAFASGFPKATRVVDGQQEEQEEQEELTDIRGGLHSGRDTSKVYTRNKIIDRSPFAGHRYGLQALKPAIEPIICFQKPYAGRPVDCITTTGAGALNIDGGRIAVNDDAYARNCAGDRGHDDNRTRGMDFAMGCGKAADGGRWPSNLVLTHAPGCVCVGSKEVAPLEGHRPNAVAVQSDGNIQFNTKPAGFQKVSYTGANGTETVADWHCADGCPVERLDAQSGTLTSGANPERRASAKTKNAYGAFEGQRECIPARGSDSGGASRFYFHADWNAEVEARLFESDPLLYQAKASRAERNAGCDGLPEREWIDGACVANRDIRPNRPNGNPHPTVKPIALAKWLATLLLPPDTYGPRRLLVPFSGSGSEMIGAILSGWEHITGIEQDADYVAIAEARLKYHRDLHSVNVGLFAETH